MLCDFCCEPYAAPNSTPAWQLRFCSSECRLSYPDLEAGVKQAQLDKHYGGPTWKTDDEPTTQDPQEYGHGSQQWGSY